MHWSTIVYIFGKLDDNGGGVNIGVKKRHIKDVPKQIPPHEMQPWSFCHLLCRTDQVTAHHDKQCHPMEPRTLPTNWAASRMCWRRCRAVEPLVPFRTSRVSSVKLSDSFRVSISRSPQLLKVSAVYCWRVARAIIYACLNLHIARSNGHSVTILEIAFTVQQLPPQYKQHKKIFLTSLNSRTISPKMSLFLLILTVDLRSPPVTVFNA